MRAGFMVAALALAACSNASPHVNDPNEARTQPTQTADEQATPTKLAEPDELTEPPTADNLVRAGSLPQPTWPTRATLRVECRSVTKILTRHHTYRFEFSVLDVLDGTFSSSSFSSTPIFSDFGGRDLVARFTLHKSTKRSGPTNTRRATCAVEQVARVEKTALGVELLWLAPLDARPRLEAFEVLIDSAATAVDHVDPSKLAPFLADGVLLSKQGFAEAVRDGSGFVSRELLRKQNQRFNVGDMAFELEYRGGRFWIAKVHTDHLQK